MRHHSTTLILLFPTPSLTILLASSVSQITPEVHNYTTYPKPTTGWPCAFADESFRPSFSRRYLNSSFSYDTLCSLFFPSSVVAVNTIYYLLYAIEYSIECSIKGFSVLFSCVDGKRVEPHDTLNVFFTSSNHNYDSFHLSPEIFSIIVAIMLTTSSSLQPYMQNKPKKSNTIDLIYRTVPCTE